MTRAIVPTEIPQLPEGAFKWSRSTRRPHSMFHAHDILGYLVCGASIRIDRHASEQLESAGAMKYFGVCTRCYNLSKKKGHRS